LQRIFEIIDDSSVEIKSQEGTDFKISSSNINAFRELTPVLQIPENFPVLIGIIDNEKVTSAMLGFCIHSEIFLFCLGGALSFALSIKNRFQPSLYP
jgi:hypothetical protein